MKVTNLQDIYKMKYEYYKQGEILMINVPTNNPNGCTQGIHPAVIISNDRISKFAPCLTVALITSKVKRLDLTFHMQVMLEKASMIMCEQTFTISKEDVLQRVGHLKDNKLSELKQCLRNIYDI